MESRDILIWIGLALFLPLYVMVLSAFVYVGKISAMRQMFRGDNFDDEGGPDDGER